MEGNEIVVVETQDIEAGLIFAVEKIGIWFNQRGGSIGYNFVPPAGQQVLVFAANYEGDRGRKDVLTTNEFHEIIRTQVEELHKVMNRKDTF